MEAGHPPVPEVLSRHAAYLQNRHNRHLRKCACTWPTKPTESVFVGFVATGIVYFCFDADVLAPTAHPVPDRRRRVNHRRVKC